MARWRAQLSFHDAGTATMAAAVDELRSALRATKA